MPFSPHHILSFCHDYQQPVQDLFSLKQILSIISCSFLFVSLRIYALSHHLQPHGSILPSLAKYTVTSNAAYLLWFTPAWGKLQTSLNTHSPLFKQTALAESFWIVFVLPYYFDLDLITKDEVTTFANSVLQFQGCSRSQGIPPPWGKGHRCRGAENVRRSLERQTCGFSFSSSDSTTNFIFTHSSYGYHGENCLFYSVIIGLFEDSWPVLMD